MRWPTWLYSKKVYRKPTADGEQRICPSTSTGDLGSWCRSRNTQVICGGTNPFAVDATVFEVKYVIVDHRGDRHNMRYRLANKKLLRMLFE